MDQTWKMTAILVLAFAIAVQSTECRLLQQTSGGAQSTYVTTPANGRSCSTVCQSPLLLANAFKTQPASYACLAKNGGNSGYQAGAGSTTCIVASGSQVVEAQDYSCLCLAPNQVPGLSLPDTSGSCTNSCKPYAGEIGTSVTVSDTSICMPTSEAGGTNHFGGLTSGKCSYASGSGVSQTAAYSCVCTYGGSTEPAGPTASNATPPAGLTQLSTAG